MNYLAIIGLILGLIISLELIGGSISFSINNKIYMSIIMEKLIYAKNKLSPLAIDIGYKLLYGFSFCQIQIEKIKNKSMSYIKSVEKYLKDNNIIVEVKIQSIKIISKNSDNEYTVFSSDKTSLEYISNIFDPVIHSGILLGDKNFETGCVNKIYYEKMPSTVDYTTSKIKFMMIELEHDGNKYTIDLKNYETNYYIVNNCLNQNFFKYYLKNVLKVSINTAKFDYIVTIIDNNANIITLLPHQYIIFNEYDYTIFPVSNTPVHDNDSSISDRYNNDEQTSIDSDKSDDFVKLEADN
jgi:hypothetical protein